MIDSDELVEKATSYMLQNEHVSLSFFKFGQSVSRHIVDLFDNFLVVVCDDHYAREFNLSTVRNIDVLCIKKGQPTH